MNKFANIINRYDDMLYESRPSSLNEFINNKYNDVHNQLYNDALNKYIKSVVSKYVDDKFTTEFDFNIAAVYNYDNFELMYDHYNKTDYVHQVLEILSIDPKICIKLLYNIKLLNDEENINVLTNKYIDEICKLYKRYHKFVEIKNSEYWMPSSIFIISKIAPFTKETVNLDKYWNTIQSNNMYELKDLKITKENILDSEIIEINYVSGKAKLQSRSTDIIYEVPFKYLDENTNVSDELILSNSFITKYNAL